MPVIYPDSDTIVSNRSTSTHRALGILVCERSGSSPFAESAYIRQLCVMGEEKGMEVFAFAPWTWDHLSGLVKGWIWSKQSRSWRIKLCPLPAVVYDRSWPANADEHSRYKQAIHHLNKSNHLTYLNNRMPHKGEVYELLSQDTTLAGFIPATRRYEGSDSLALWLREYNHSAFLKPASGTKGKRVVAFIHKQDGSVQLTGRQSDNRPFSFSCVDEKTALRLLERWIGHQAYLMQPLLDLRGPKDEPFDIRALMQKNKRALWTMTGMAARCGQQGSITSNLHGGGIALPANEVLTALFGEQRGKELLQEIRKLSFQLVNRLEETMGRFAEVGMDYGIDRSGKIWFLEANSKPGRHAMDAVSKAAAHMAAEQPLSYARAILLRPPGRVIHEFDHL